LNNNQSSRFIGNLINCFYDIKTVVVLCYGAVVMVYVR